MYFGQFLWQMNKVKYIHEHSCLGLWTPHTYSLNQVKKSENNLLLYTTTIDTVLIDIHIFFLLSYFYIFSQSLSFSFSVEVYSNATICYNSVLSCINFATNYHKIYKSSYFWKKNVL